MIGDNYFPADSNIYYLNMRRMLSTLTVDMLYQIYTTFEDSMPREYERYIKGWKIDESWALYNLLHSNLVVFDELKLQFHYSVINSITYVGEQPFWRMVLFDGRELICSPRQKVLTETLEWKSIQNVRKNDRLITSPKPPKKLNSQWIREDGFTKWPDKHPDLPYLEIEYGDVKSVNSCQILPAFNIELYGNYDTILINNILTTTSSTEINPRNIWNNTNV